MRQFNSSIWMENHEQYYYPIWDNVDSLSSTISSIRQLKSVQLFYSWSSHKCLYHKMYASARVKDSSSSESTHKLLWYQCYQLAYDLSIHQNNAVNFNNKWLNAARQLPLTNSTFELCHTISIMDRLAFAVIVIIESVYSEKFLFECTSVRISALYNSENHTSLYRKWIKTIISCNVWLSYA